MNLAAPLTALIAGRKVILVGRPVDEVRPFVELLTSYGAGGIFVVANGPPSPAPCIEPGIEACFEVDLGYVDEGAVRRASLELLSNPPDALIRSLADFDPANEALIICEGRSQLGNAWGRRVLDPGQGLALQEKAAALGAGDVPLAPGRFLPTADFDPHTLAAFDLEGRGSLWWGGLGADEGSTVSSSWVVRAEPTYDARWQLGGRAAYVSPRLERDLTGGFGFATQDATVVFGLHTPFIAVDRDSGRLLRLGSQVEWPTRGAHRGVEEVRRVGESLRGQGYVGPFLVDGYALGGDLSPLWVLTDSTVEHAQHAERLGSWWPLLNGLLRRDPLAPSYDSLRAAPGTSGFLGKLNVPVPAPERPLVRTWDDPSSGSRARVALVGSPEGAVLLLEGRFANVGDALMCAADSLASWQYPCISFEPL